MREYIVQYERKEADNPKDKCDLCNHAIVGELVRCKDCRHGQYDATHYFCAEHYHKVYEDDYCSHGERRENGERLYTHEEAWADIDGRPHGEWLDWLGSGNEWECSVCKCSIESHGSIAYNFCPMCGADMRPLTGTERIRRIEVGEDREERMDDNK